MGWRPKLNAVCAACGKPRELFGHVCVSPRRKASGFRLKVTYGTCPKCKRRFTGSPVTHVCAARSDFRRRKSQFEREQAKREREKNKKPAHDYTECSDEECKRSRCVAFKAGREIGDEAGFERGWEIGHARGIADCPRDHK